LIDIALNFDKRNAYRNLAYELSFREKFYTDFDDHIKDYKELFEGSISLKGFLPSQDFNFHPRSLNVSHTKLSKK